MTSAKPAAEVLTTWMNINVGKMVSKAGGYKGERRDIHCSTCSTSSLAATSSNRSNMAEAFS
jgi:hypothetical protein